ncbi:MAG: indolepyruvate ferredoxin oxidoreductase subunit alpha [Tissierellaceae bacterium]|nr:indolepyruvate ferredoxin oxidoreductase subunit alpha [Tissierellaceae bacterium]
MKKLMTGNEAVAYGAYEAGVRYASAYPGTPSTEILENIALYGDIKAEWSANEKVALEAAIGASIAGGRALSSMKHVGLNVASDAFMTVAYTGVNAGLVVITADEPGQHSSQNEQDNRHFAPFGKVPMLEPSDSQESKDMIGIALQISEDYDTPVLFRMTTRVCHSKSIVECGERQNYPIREYKKDKAKYVVVPAYATKMRVKVEERLKKLAEYSNKTDLNFIKWNDKKIGVISSGICYNYARAVFGDSASYLKLGFTYPFPDEKIREFASQVDKIYIIEENDPIIEERVKMLGFECHGKDIFPSYGELTPDVLRKSIEGQNKETIDYDKTLVVSRPPSLCAGCPHRGFFYEIGKSKDVVIAGDIGCYTLGVGDPYDAIDITIDMGSAFGVGHGAQSVFNMKEGNKKRVIAVQGDSTFFHTGINGLLSTVYNNGNTINVILDNRTTGMTGHQENPGTGYTLDRGITESLDIEALVRACGIKHVKKVDPNQLDQMGEAIDWALSIEEASVIITRWPCAIKKLSEEDREEFKDVFTEKYRVNPVLCISCKQCTRCGCPAIEFSNEYLVSKIDINSCVGCGVCSQVCPALAIGKVEK